ncbi:MAG: sterol desaturase family protein, partial [Betaproteobacteria bacterium]|nr:sterol desaturase family protein [Betaproteobacteria bacterium]
AQHAYPWLWATHRLHHTETNLNVTSTLRLHWLEELFLLAGVILPMLVLFGIGPPAAADCSRAPSASGCSSFHMNARISFGPCRGR